MSSRGESKKATDAHSSSQSPLQDRSESCNEGVYHVFLDCGNRTRLSWLPNWKNPSFYCYLFLVAEIKVYLNKLDWPVGLQNLLIDGVKNVPSKFFVCDDSGSMMNIDGRRLVRAGDTFKWVDFAHKTTDTINMPSIYN